MFQVPWPSSKSIRRRRQGPHWADLNGVAREIRTEWLFRERRNFNVFSSAGKFDQGFTGNFVSKTSTSAALNTALSVQQDQLRKGDWLREVTLLFNKTSLAWPVCQRLVLERALPALVANWAVQGVVRQEKLEDPVLSLLDLVRISDHGHVVRRFNETRWLQCWSSAGVNFDQTHSAHADWFHSWVITKTRDVGSCLFGRGDQHVAFLGRDISSIKVERHRGDAFGSLLSHVGTLPL